MLLTFKIDYCCHNFFVKQGLNIASASYELKWYDKNREFKKNLLLVIIRSQKPLVLSIGPLGPLTTETFVSVSV